MKGNFLQLSAKLYAIIYIYWASAGLRLYKNGKSKTKGGKKIYKKKGNKYRTRKRNADDLHKRHYLK